jgi:hypothetical protein
MTIRLPLHRLGVSFVLAFLVFSPNVVTGAGQTPANAPADNQLTLPLRLRAFAINMSNIGTGRAGMVEIRITQWSPAEEREKVITTMLDQGQNALLRLLQGLPPKGRLRFPNHTGPDPTNIRLGWDLRYTATTPEPDGGHRIIIGLDRTMSFQEVRNQPRTVDYPFTLIEIHLNKDGEGQGKLAYAARIIFDKAKNTVYLENFSTEPLRLNQVRLERG